MPRRKKEDTLFMMLWRKNEKLDSPILILFPQKLYLLSKFSKIIFKKGGGGRIWRKKYINPEKKITDVVSPD